MPPTTTPPLLDDHLVELVAAMIDRTPVTVTTELRNGAGEVTKQPGWATHIREIRRPATHVDAYGHLQPVVVVEGDPNDPDHRPGLSICLAADQVTVTATRT